MRAAWLALAVLFSLAGCAPSPPDGAYLCSASDGECPGDQRCTCGLCVSDPHAAVCSIALHAVSLADGSALTTVAEHQQFGLEVSLAAPDGTPSGYRGLAAIALQGQGGGPWGDVLVARKRATSVDLAAPQPIPIELNRETLSDGASLAVTVAAQTGSLTMIVTPQKLVRDQAAAVPLEPVSSAVVMSQPAVAHAADGFHLYYGYGSDLFAQTAQDGATWTPVSPNPTAAPPFGTGDPPSAFVDPSGQVDLVGWVLPGSTQQVVYYQGGSGQFSAAPQVLLDAIACANDGYCNAGIGDPQIVTGLPPSPTGSTVALFFTTSDLSQEMASLHAVGAAFGKGLGPLQVEPSVVLQADSVDEVFFDSPRILIDGSVYKMWYAFGTLGQLVTYRANGKSTVLGCDPGTSIRLGYATSLNGTDWVRSAHRDTDPPLDLASGTVWDAGARNVTPGAVLPRDGEDPASGIALYYRASLATTCGSAAECPGATCDLVRHFCVAIGPNGSAILCTHSGIGRAIALPE